MRIIERSSLFKWDYKRVKATPRYSKILDDLLYSVLESLLLDKALPEKNYDHALSGNWAGHRDVSY